jgi:alkylresorcinol/alkylpyrone synthase
MKNNHAPRLAGLVTAVPPHILDTDHVVKQAGRIFARFGSEFERMLPVFTNTGINRRYSVCPTDWFDEGNGWPGRTSKFLEGAKMLFRQAATDALDQAELTAAEIDIVITVSSTGIATPSIEAHVMHEMGFRDDVMRVPVFGLGCAGGVSGMALAAKLAEGPHKPKVLLVVIELCTLAFRPDEMTKSNIVATALFGDGAAAAVISQDSAGPAIEFTGQHTWPNTINVMGWRVDDVGFGAIFDRSIPDLVLSDLRKAADQFKQRMKLNDNEIDAYSFHPGGSKVITALETTFELGEGKLVDERKVLAGFGNMSAPTVMFVLKEALAKGPVGRRFVGSLGPGFTASFLTLLDDAA